jgi:hypothetical protein
MRGSAVIASSVCTLVGAAVPIEQSFLYETEECIEEKTEQRQKQDAAP